MSKITPRLFVLTRKNISKSSPAVQAGHAVAQFQLEHPQAWQNEFLIFLQVRDLQELEKWKSVIARKYPTSLVSEFHEPDLNSELTAMAVANINPKVFMSLKLL